MLQGSPGDTFICVYPDKLPAVMLLDHVLIGIDLQLERGRLVLIIRRNTHINSDTQDIPFDARNLVQEIFIRRERFQQVGINAFVSLTYSFYALFLADMALLKLT
ncbi:MAG: hypothetical protein LUE87_06180, partial [Lachnospiraceae bacterium]|nr:hypothetical protein [Lachnospiraceae bacterium]